MNYDFFQLLGIAIISVILIITIKQQNKEISLLLGLVAGILFFIFIIDKVKIILDFTQEIISLSKIPSETFLVLIKVLGIAFISQFVSDICKDAGENGVATKVEVAAKVTMLVIAIPIFEKILKMIINVMG